MLLSSSVAADACPTSADLDRGVQLGWARSFTSMLFRRIDGVLFEGAIVTADIPDTPEWRRYDHPLLSSWQRADINFDKLTYDPPVDQLDQLQPGQTWRSTRMYLSDAHPDLIDHYEIIRYDVAPGERQLGDCTYEVIYFGRQSGVDHMHDLEYAPALGMVSGFTNFTNEGFVDGWKGFDSIQRQ